MVMSKTVWFTEPIDYRGRKTDSLVVDRLTESETSYELVTDIGETVVVEKERVDRIE